MVVRAGGPNVLAAVMCSDLRPPYEKHETPVSEPAAT
jgi:hypothetical protein